MQRVSPREDSPLRTLRRQPGNGAIRRLVKRGVGPTLNIDDPGDRYEHEADRVATQVMHGRERATKTEAWVLTATALLYFHGHQYRAPDVFANGTQTKFIDLRSRARACSTA
jgi:hypothetical protein